MTLAEEFLTHSVDDLASPDFRTRLTKQLERSTFVVITEAIAGIVSLAVVTIGLLVLFGYLKGNNSDPLGLAIAVLVGTGGGYLLRYQIQDKKIRRAYQSILNDPTQWNLETTEINRVSQFAFPTTGSDNNAVRVFWGGTNAGAASIETNRVPLGHRISIATSHQSATLIVSLNLKK